MIERQRSAWARALMALALMGGASTFVGCGGDEVPDGVATPTPELEVDESKSTGFQKGPKPSR